MTNLMLDWRHFRVELACPSCGYKDFQLIGEMIGKDSIPCRACREIIDISSDDWQTALKKISDGISEIYVITGK